MIVNKFFLSLLVSLIFSNAFAADLVEVPMIYAPQLKAKLTLSNGFLPHRGFAGTGFRMEPLTPNVSPMDYKAWHDESWDDLTIIYGPAWSWPREMDENQNSKDLFSKHYALFLSLDWITYTVLTPDGKQVIGSLYITPQACGSYGATALYWITTPMRKEVEATFHAEVKAWLNSVFPWKSTFFPGPEVTDAERGHLYDLAENSHICN
jgi:hypothetical protein